MALSESPDQTARFLRSCFESEDWTAFLVRIRDAAWSVQRTGPLTWACRESVHEWLRIQNESRCDIYVGVNALAVGARSRTRRDVAIVRHVFLDVDQDLKGALRQLDGRPALPRPSYLVHTSPSRAHVLWRVRDFDLIAAERLQKRLAADMGGDPAATSVTQLTRAPGFWNHKYEEPHLTWVEYRDVERIYTPRDFVDATAGEAVPKLAPKPCIDRCLLGATERARSYLRRMPPAIAGHHGDLHTFQTCCRVVRGFALDDDQALAVLAEWNAQCQPPWTERELVQKIRSARRNGREPIGGLL
ncbi:MAG: DNA-primase RepB domain-containing protein [Vicinamibacterales bacterium]